MTAPSPPTLQTCSRCGGEGKLYTSRYGGNDPDVWPIGECPVCEGTGSELYETEPVEEEEIMHVTPVNDLREHVDSASCWCKPTPLDDEPSVLVHHSMDGREDYETGKRRPS